MSKLSSHPGHGHAPAGQTFRDGLGERHVAVDPESGETCERLQLVTDLVNQHAPVKERVERLLNFRNVRFPRLHHVVHETQGQAKGLAIVSDHVPGVRLANLLEVVDAHQSLVLDVNAALQVAREVLPALGVLHDSRGVTHGAVGLERLILTPQARVVITDFALGAGLTKLQFPRTRLWREFRIAMPPSASVPRFDTRADVANLALALLALINGRPLNPNDFPAALPKLLENTVERLPNGAVRDMSPALIAWFERALPLESRRPFGTASEAHLALEEVLKKERLYAPASSALKSFLERYDSCCPTAEPAHKSERHPESHATGGSSSRAAASAAPSNRRGRGPSRTPPPVRRLTPDEEQAEEIRALEAELARLAQVEAAEALAAALAKGGSPRSEGADSSSADEPGMDGVAPVAAHVSGRADRETELALETQAFEEELLAELDLALDAPAAPPSALLEAGPDQAPPVDVDPIQVEPVIADALFVTAEPESELTAIPLAEEVPLAAVPFVSDDAFEAEIVSVGHEMPALDVASLSNETTATIVEHIGTDLRPVADENDQELLELERLLDEIRRSETPDPTGAPADMPPVDEQVGPLWSLTSPEWIEQGAHFDGAVTRGDGDEEDAVPRCPDTCALDFDTPLPPESLEPAWVLIAETMQRQAEASDATTCVTEADDQEARCTLTLPLNFEIPVYVQELVAAGAATAGLIAEPSVMLRDDVIRLQMFAAASPGGAPRGVLPLRRAHVQRVRQRVARHRALPERTSAVASALAVRHRRVLDVVSQATREADPGLIAFTTLAVSVPRVRKSVPLALAAEATPVEARLTGPVRATVLQTIAATAARNSVLRLVPPIERQRDLPIVAAVPSVPIVADPVEEWADTVSAVAMVAEVQPPTLQHPGVVSAAADPVAEERRQPTMPLRLVTSGPAPTVAAVPLDAPAMESPTSGMRARRAGAPKLPPSVEAELQRLLAKFDPTDDRRSLQDPWRFEDDLVSRAAAPAEAPALVAETPAAPPPLPVPSSEHAAATESAAEPLAAAWRTEAAAESLASPVLASEPESVVETLPVEPLELTAEAEEGTQPDGRTQSHTPVDGVDDEMSAIEALLREADEADRAAGPSQAFVDDEPRAHSALNEMAAALEEAARHTGETNVAILETELTDAAFSDATTTSSPDTAEAIPSVAATGEPKTRSRAKRRSARKRGRGKGVPSPSPAPAWQVPTPSPSVSGPPVVGAAVATAEDVVLLASDSAPRHLALVEPVVHVEPQALVEAVAARSMSEAPIRYEPWRAIPHAEPISSPSSIAARAAAPKSPDPWNVEVEAAKEAQVVPFTPKPVEWSSAIRLEREDVELQLQRDLFARASVVPGGTGEEDADTRLASATASRKGWRVNWKRTAAASLTVMLLEGVAFAMAYWIVKPAELGTLLVQTSQPGVEVLIDGRPSGKTPLTADLKPGRHTLEMRGYGSTKVVPVEISPGVQTTQSVKWPRVGRVGTLVVTTTPPGARVLVDGVLKGTSPVTLQDVAAGPHTVVAESQNGTVKSQVRVSPNETAELDLGIFSGWITVFSPVEVRVFESGKLLGTSLDGKLLISAGTHTLELVNKTLGYHERHTVEIEPGKASVLSIEAPNGSIIIEAPDGTEIFVDGQPAGTTPVEKVSAPIGTRDIVLRHPAMGQRRMTVTVGAEVPARVSMLAPQ